MDKKPPHLLGRGWRKTFCFAVFSYNSPHLNSTYVDVDVFYHPARMYLMADTSVIFCDKGSELPDVVRCHLGDDIPIVRNSTSDEQVRKRT